MWHNLWRIFLFFVCLNFVEVGFDSPAKLATGVPPFKCEPTSLALPRVGLDVMSGSHCIHPIGGLLVRLKQKNLPDTGLYGRRPHPFVDRSSVS